MIIDLILDRYDGKEYNAKEFYCNCLGYNRVFTGIADKITAAMDYGTEYDVKNALSRYIIDNHYALWIIGYVDSVKWLEDDIK